MHKKQFKAESARLLDLMINSIYTHKEIFLRELISNASDALDKYYLYSLERGKSPENLSIRIDLNEERRTLTISDNGIGMSEKELEDNLGTIARSGSRIFKENLAEKDASSDGIDIIGQFGVGFYSAFMVSSTVTVISRKAGSSKAWQWQSSGNEGYEIEPAQREEHGTTVILQLKENDDIEDYGKFLVSDEIAALVKRYSDYIRYPIQMDVQVESLVPGIEESVSPKYETVTETKTLNTMVPIWKRARNDITDEDFAAFYQKHFSDWNPPMKSIYFSVEENVSFTALLFIPSAAPADFYTREYHPGLELFSRGVFIEEHCEALLPPYLRFVRGLVDSQDLSLNISREMLQHDNQLRIIRSRIEKKILSELSSMMEKDREEYLRFWKLFGLDIKFGCYNDYGINAKKLENYLLFYGSMQEKMVSLKEYVRDMPEGQKEIYYVSGQSADLIQKLPIVVRLKEKGYSALCLSDDVDELVLSTLREYSGFPFRNALQGNLDLDSEEEKKELEEQTRDNLALLEVIRNALPQVSEVRLSSRMKDDPVVLVAGDGLSFEMEKIFEVIRSQSPEETGMSMKASRILEINPSHPIWKVLRATFAAGDVKTVDEIASVLYHQALLIEGFKIEDPITYSKELLGLISSLANRNAGEEESA